MFDAHFGFILALIFFFKIFFCYIFTLVRMIASWAQTSVSLQDELGRSCNQDTNGIGNLCQLWAILICLPFRLLLDLLIGLVPTINQNTIQILIYKGVKSSDSLYAPASQLTPFQSKYTQKGQNCLQDGREYSGVNIAGFDLMK